MSTTIVAVDFDGTLCDHRFPDIGDEAPHAFEWLHRYQVSGAKLILWTMRSVWRDGTDPLTDAVEWCRARGVEFWGVNKNPEQKDWTASPKVYAHVYIDDAAFGCPLRMPARAGSRPIVDWYKLGPQVMNLIETRKRNGAAEAGPLNQQTLEVAAR